MRLNFGKIFQETSKDRSMGGVVSIPKDTSLWPPSWSTIEYKTYERFPRIELPSPVPQIFGHTELLNRKSVRDFGVFDRERGIKIYKKLTLAQISNILYYSCGEIKKSPNIESSKRIQPSGGARYPIEAYVLNFEPGDLDTFCYHYNVKDHTLEKLWGIPMTSRNDISTYFAYEWSTDCSAAIILSAVVNRTTMKYGERGYRYIYLEAGAILNNIQNNAMLEGIGSVIMGGTNEPQVEELLDFDGEQETVIMGILLG